jgi:AhpD family alkylhydroperoxidase
MAGMKRELPDAGRTFHEFHHSLMGDSALTEHQKELIAIGISIAIRCEACIYAHIQRARTIGATRDEILDAAKVSLMMQGGPGYVYLPKVIEALDALEANELRKLEPVRS